MKISVIIPFNKDRGWLKNAVQSVENQRVDAEVELIFSESNNSVAYNLNQGIIKSTGDYIRYLSEDDYLAIDSLQNSLDTIQEYDFIHGCCEDFITGGSATTYIPPMQYPTLQDLLQHSLIHGGSLMYRRELFNKFGLFDESLNEAEEYEYNLRLLKNNCRLGYCDAILYHYRRHNGQKSLGSHVDQLERLGRIEEIRNRYR